MTFSEAAAVPLKINEDQYGPTYEFILGHVNKGDDAVKTKKEKEVFIEQEKGSVTHGNQDDSDVVGAAPPHRLAGQLLTGSFVPELLLWKLRLHQLAPLHNCGVLPRQHRSREATW